MRDYQTVAERYSPYLRWYYECIKRHRGSGKAIIATARKFLGIIYQTLKSGWTELFVFARNR